MKTLLTIGLFGGIAYVAWRLINDRQSAYVATDVPVRKPEPSVTVPSRNFCKDTLTITGSVAAGGYGVPPQLSGNFVAGGSGLICGMGEKLAKGAVPALKAPLALFSDSPSVQSKLASWSGLGTSPNTPKPVAAPKSATYVDLFGRTIKR